MRRAAGPFLTLTVLALLVACTSGHRTPRPFPALPGLDATTVSTVDYSAVELGTVPGRKVISVALGPGRATLGGTVVGPDGPLGGATVHLEREVDGAVGALNVGTQPDGTWSAPSLLGGLFRVRAFRAPDLALVTPAVFYLGGSETRMVNLKVDRFSGRQVVSAIAPNPPIVDRPSSLVVEVTSSTVDGAGIVRAAPVAGVAVQLFGEGHWEVRGSASGTTNGGGQYSFTLTCQQIGNQPLSVVISAAEVFPLTIPPCGLEPPTTTIPAPTASTTSPGPSTTRPHKLGPSTTLGP